MGFSFYQTDSVILLRNTRMNKTEKVFQLGKGFMALD